jgi:hypothetical protein
MGVVKGELEGMWMESEVGVLRYSKPWLIWSNLGGGSFRLLKQKVAPKKIRKNNLKI